MWKSMTRVRPLGLSSDVQLLSRVIADGYSLLSWEGEYLSFGNV